ncbi:MAG: hypothetical protein K2H52_16110 [Lachnospiraceae bacterium]|nr:hypothetical protein [Lachnospiraceae bacterium]MDE6185467.1 hypothetical protein [Lachnospiraceae bacterium]
MKKRFVALTLAIMLTLSVTACGGKDTSTSAESNEVQTQEEETPSEEEAPSEEETPAEADEEAGEETEQGAEAPEETDVLAAALENMKSVTNLEGQMLMEMNLEVSADGESDSVESVTSMDMTLFSDPRKIKVEMNMDMGAAGSVQQSIYGEVAEDGTSMMYLYDGANWQSQQVDTADMMQYDASSSMLSLINDGSVYTLEGMEEVNGANAYKYVCVTSGEDAKQQLLSAGALDSLTSLGMDMSQLEALMDDVGELTEYVWIDEASLYPVKYETDMTQIMDKLLSSIVDSMGEQAEGISMSTTKMKLSMTCFNFNNATDFTIPEEAKAE